MQLHHTIQIVNHHSLLIRLQSAPELFICATPLNRRDRVMSRITVLTQFPAVSDLEL